MHTRNRRRLPNLAEASKPKGEARRMPRWRQRFIMVVERFGFLAACVLTLVALIIFFISSGFFKRQTDQVASRTVALEEGVPAEGGSGSAGQPAPAAEVALSVATRPAGASIYVDGEYVGVSPIRGLVVTQGRRLISVQKPKYAQLDTLIALNHTAASLQFSLADGGVTLAAVPERTTPPAAPAPPNKARQVDPPSRPTTSLAEGRAESEVLDGRQNVPMEVDAPAAEVEDALAAPVVATPTGQAGELHIVSEPAGATVSMAGEAVGVTPLVLSDVAPGQRRVKLQLEGYEDYITTVAVSGQQRSTVSGQLKQQLGLLKVLARPWGTIYIDGTLHKDEANAWYIAKLTPGFHRLRVVHPTLGTWEQVVDVAIDQERSITIDFNKNDM